MLLSPEYLIFPEFENKKKRNHQKAGLRHPVKLDESSVRHSVLSVEECLESNKGYPETEQGFAVALGCPPETNDNIKY